MRISAPFYRVFVLCLLSLLIVSAEAQQLRIAARAEARVSKVVDSRVRLSLQNSVPAVVRNATIGSQVAGSIQLEHMYLLLKPTDAQEAALKTLLDAQQDKNSQYFHKWLTPTSFGESFGVAPADISAVSNWLQNNGMTVEKVYPNGRLIEFSGTVSNVSAAFQTEVRTLQVNGEEHISNTTEVSVPGALAPVIKGIVRLNDFLPHGSAHFYSTVAKERAAEAQGGAVTPAYGTASGTHYVSPGDVASIFNTKPLITAAQPITGAGVTVSVLARSNINLGDVATFRQMFGLPANNPTVTVIGSDPGSNEDDTEAYLDAEWAGAMAPNAKVNFIVSSSSLVADGIDAAGLYAVNNNIGDIISLSYGGCEANNGATATAFYNDLWEQAAAQGQTALVSSGDSGAAGCASSSATYASGGYGVNALGSSAYNVSVGGSMFVDYGSSQYWGATGGTTIPFANALGYIPEAALNEGRLSTTLLNGASTASTSSSGVFSGGGGISIYTARPSWQAGSGIDPASDPKDYQGNVVPLTGTTVTGPHRLTPDVSLISASGHAGTLFCASGICATTAAGSLANAGIVGGTSVATPVMASIQALINEKNGGRQGNTNVYYYKLASAQYNASTSACQSVNGTAANPTVTMPAASCNFHDIVAGSNVVPTAAFGTAGIGFTAGPGYDPASGLGSVNAANVANNWSSVTFNATSITFSLTPTTDISHGTNQTATVTVSPASGNGVPTGDVSLILSAQTAYGAPQILTLNGGTATAVINSLPAGTYTVYAHYAGDATFAGSDSAPIPVTIGKENSQLNLYNYNVTTSGGLTQASAFTYGSSTIYVDAEVTGVSGAGTASGTVTFTPTRNGAQLPTLTTNLDTYGTTYLQSGQGYANYYLVPNYATLAPGSYSLKADYSGDSSFNPSTSTTTFTVPQATPSATLTAASSQITPGQNATLTFRIAPPTGAAAAATGTVQFTDSTTATNLGTLPLVNGAVTLTTTSITASGANSITATYSGDTNYLAASATTTITVGNGTAPTVTVSDSGTHTVGATVRLTATLSTAAASTTAVAFYDGATLLGSANASSTTASLSYSQFTAGTHSISAIFAGNATQASAQSSAYSLPIAQSTTAVALTAGNVQQAYGDVRISASISRTPSTTTAPAVGLTGTVSFYDTSVTPAVLVGQAVPVFDPAGYGKYSAGTTLSLSPGTHAISAVYSGDANYTSSTSANTATYTIAQGNPVVSVAPASGVYGAVTSTLSATVTYGGSAAPTGQVSFSIDGGTAVAATCNGSSSPLLCTAVYNTSTLTVPSHTITATIAANANYNSGTGTGSFTVTKATPVITFSVSNHTYGDAPFAVSASSSSTGAFTYSVLSGPATISGSTVTITGAGTVVLQASQAADANYIGNTKQASFNVAQGTAAITFAVGNHTYGDAPFAVSATSSSTGAFTYSVVSGPATISGNTVTLTGAGTVVLQASQAADANYAANTKQTSFTVTAATAAITFTVGNHTYGDVPFAVSASSSSTGAFTYSVVSGPATISGNTVTLTGAGTVVLQASQAADANYIANTKQASFSVTQGTAAITFAVSNHTYGDAPFTISAASASTGSFTYTVVSGPATISGNTVTLTGAGTVVLQVSQAADANYAANTKQASINVSQATAAITFAVGNHTYGDAPFAVSANSSSTGAFTYSVVSGSATISGNTVTLTGAGTVVLQASQAADANYAANTKQASISVSQATAAITFAVGNHTYGDAPFAVSASSSSTGAFTYTVVSGPATISGNTVTLTGAGTVVLQASQAADTNYAANAKQASFTVSKASSTTTTITPIIAMYGTATTATVTVPTTGGSAATGSVQYSFDNGAVTSAPVTNGSATIIIPSTLNGGSHTVLVTYSGDSNYGGGSAQQIFTVKQSSTPPTLTFAPIATQTYGDAPFAVSASSVSTGAVTYSVVSGPATITGNTVMLTGAGMVVLQASQAADANYKATTGTTSFQVSMAAGPALTFAPIATHAYGDAPFTVSASSVSTGAITYSVVSGPATITGNTVAVTGAGTVVLQASQAADANYKATTGTTSFQVNMAAGPALTFSPIAAHTYGDAAFTVSASSASTGAITYSVVSGPATILGNTVTLTGAGAVVLQASQAADANYAASMKTTTLTVSPAVTVLAFPLPASIVYGTPLSAAQLNASASASGLGAVAGMFSYSPAPGTVLNAGTATLSTQFTPSNLVNFTTPAAVTTSITVTQAQTLTVVTTSASPVLEKVPVTFTAVVTTTAGGTVPVGTVTFSDGGSSLGTATLNASGVATYTASFTGSGNHTVTAAYSGNANQAASSGAVIQTIGTAATLVLTDGGQSNFAVTVQRGLAAQTTVTLTPGATFAGTVAFSCAGLPANVSCEFTPASVALAQGSAAQSISLLIRTASLQTTSLRTHTMDETLHPRLALAFALPGMLMAGVGVRSRRLRGMRGLCMVFVCIVSLAVLAGLTGCGSGNRQPYTVTNAAPGTYTINVVATSGGSTATLPVTLTIQ